MMQGSAAAPRRKCQLRADDVARVQALAANRAPFRPAVSYGAALLPFRLSRFCRRAAGDGRRVRRAEPAAATVQYLYPDTPNYYYQLR